MQSHLGMDLAEKQRVLFRLAQRKRRVTAADVRKATGCGERQSFVLLRRVRELRQELAKTRSLDFRVLVGAPGRPRRFPPQAEAVLRRAFKALRRVKGERLRQELGWKRGHLKRKAPHPKFGELALIARRLGINASTATLNRVLRRLQLRMALGRLTDRTDADRVWRRHRSNWLRQVSAKMWPN